MRCRINIKGQAKAVVPEVTIESEDGVVNSEHSDNVLAEAKRVYNDAEQYCMSKMR